MQLIALVPTAYKMLALHLTRLWGRYVIADLVLTLGIFWYVLFLPPTQFLPGTTILVESGVTVSHEAALLKQAGLIRSTLLFRALYRFMPERSGVRSGVYLFPKPMGELALALDLARGTSQVPEVRITFPEGMTVRQMGALLAKVLPRVAEHEFIFRALPLEGYLFPNTYFFRPDATSEEIVTILTAEFNKKVTTLRDQIHVFGKSEKDVVIMASILEGEGKTLEDKRVISGILWRRLALHMRLQVDAPFGYVHGKTGYVPTRADLTSASPYNTYRQLGLPPTPINNPGLVSLQAAVTPTKTEYFYYLTGSDGKMHYAKTFAEHIQNQKKYFK